ncbi:MAG: hypothetical protein IAE66_06305 [Xanthomonadaceae bacterium]|nr:hypothetical protein [Xanthomonadaceae bacterium]
MSALIWYADNDRAIVATDTLCMTRDGVPVGFMTKAHYLPALRSVVAYTGCGGLGCAWAAYANSELRPRGLEHLSERAPALLNEFFGKMSPEWQEISTTIYHIGFSEVTGKAVVHAFRSSRKFAKEELETGVMYMKPESDVDLSQQSDASLAEKLKFIMDAQRAEQALVPQEDRVNIGGELIVLEMTREACTQYVGAQFSDFEEQKRQSDVQRA